MYAKCADIGNALKVSIEFPNQTQVSWNSIIAALCMFEEWVASLDAFRIMQEEGFGASSFTLVSVSLAGSGVEKYSGLRLVKELHGMAFGGTILCWETYTYNSLIALYAKLGSVCDSVSLFDRFVYGDIVTWNTMVSSLAQKERYVEAVDVVRRMVVARFKPDGVTLSSVLPACSQIEMLDFGKAIHAFSIRNDGLCENSFVGSALVDMYCRFGEILKARIVFDGVSEPRLGLWNAMISGYAQNEFDEEALELFIAMEEAAGFCPNAATLARVLPSCVRSQRFSCRKASMDMW
ncbi:Pentatricopeptide repeat-containing protein [Platanthera guangdongensis]|uniref:Pentatricopeptide repeat-containing protein n=1 Tax=Platanthera guangdongensis TaxID=2320717 RepID=A0ABR2MNX3_9ASPA